MGSACDALHCIPCPYISTLHAFYTWPPGCVHYLHAHTYIHTYTLCDHHSWCALSGLCRLGVYGCVLMDMHVSQTRRTCQFDDIHMYKRCHHVSNTYYLLTLGQCHVFLLLTMYHGTYRCTDCQANTSSCMLPTRFDTGALHTACSGVRVLL